MPCQTSLPEMCVAQEKKREKESMKTASCVFCLPPFRVIICAEKTAHGKHSEHIPGRDPEKGHGMHFVDAKGILTAGGGQNGMNVYRGCTHGCI